MSNKTSLLTYKLGLPFIFGSLFMIVSGSNLIASMIAEATIGRPSSTFALGYVQIPMAMLTTGVVGFCIGLLVAQLIGRYRPQWEDFINIKSPLIIIMFLIILSIGVYLSVNASYNNVNNFEERSKPHVISDNGILTKVSSLPFNSPSVQDSVNTWDLIKQEESDNLVYDLIYSLFNWITGTDKNTPTINWNNRQVTVVSNNDKIIIRDKAGKKIAKTDLRKYNYTRELWAVPVRFQIGEPEYLVVFANLRSTSNRAMVLVYHPEGLILYQELLVRYGCDSTIRKITDPESHQESVEVKTHKTFYLIASQ